MHTGPTMVPQQQYHYDQIWKKYAHEIHSIIITHWNEENRWDRFWLVGVTITITIGYQIDVPFNLKWICSVLLFRTLTFHTYMVHATWFPLQRPDEKYGRAHILQTHCIDEKNQIRSYPFCVSKRAAKLPSDAAKKWSNGWPLWVPHNVNGLASNTGAKIKTDYLTRKKNRKHLLLIFSKLNCPKLWTKGYHRSSMLHHEHESIHPFKLWKSFRMVPSFYFISRIFQSKIFCQFFGLSRLEFLNWISI